MQTFLPYADFEASAAALDPPRLGKQRVETLQILRALELPEYGWANHPAVVMWRHHVPALVLYGLVCARAWTRLGHADSTYDQMAEFAPGIDALTQADLAARGMLPSWLGDPRLHTSHRSKLLTKDPEYYASRFAGTPLGLDYFWPPADPAPAGDPDGPAGAPLWVLTVESPARLGTLLDEGVVALGTESGMTGDATGHDIADLLAALGVTRRTKALLALARFVTEIETGDRIGVLVDRRTRLLVGTVTGDYHWAKSAEHGLHHRRPVAFDEVLLRADIDPPASLQDVRPLFRVHRRAPTPVSG